MAYLERAKALHASTILADGHNDLPWAIGKSFSQAEPADRPKMSVEGVSTQRYFLVLAFYLLPAANNRTRFLRVWGVGARVCPQVDLTTHEPRLHTDIPRLKQGGMGLQFCKFSNVLIMGSSMRLRLD